MFISTLIRLSKALVLYLISLAANKTSGFFDLHYDTKALFTF